MTRRELLPVALVVLALVGDGAGAPSFSFYLLLAAVPAIVVAGLAALEELVEPGALAQRRAIALLHVLTLVLVLVSAALRAPMRAEGAVPRAAVSATVACLVVFGIQALLAWLPTLRRAAPERPKRAELPAPVVE